MNIAYNQALEDFAGKILDWKQQDEEYRSFEDVVNEIKEQLRILLEADMEDYENALEWVKRISKYGEYRNGHKNWSGEADKYIPMLEDAIEKAERYDDYLVEYDFERE